MGYVKTVGAGGNEGLLVLEGGRCFGMVDEVIAG